MRAAIYTRVSTSDQIDGFSLSAQERACRAYCEAHGWEVARHYRDEGISAHSEDIAKRPAFAEMLADADAGAFDVLVVHKLDRFARNIVVALTTLRRLEARNVSFVSISESLDFSTPIGRVILATLAAFAQYYSDNLSTETRKGKAERKRQGLYNGLLPFGVTTDHAGVPVRDERPWACHLDTRAELAPAHGLDLCFRLAAEGHSDRDIARRLTAQGYRTSGNRGQNPFTKDTVRAILRNRFYVGELPDGDGGTMPGRHAPLVDIGLFARVQQLRAVAGRQQSRHGQRAPWALSGLAVCGVCGRTLQGAGIYARCPSRIQGTSCGAPSARIDRLVEQVGNGFAAFAALDPTQAARYERAVARQATVADRSTEASRALLGRRLARARELYLDGDLDKAGYQAERDRIERELALLPEAPPEPARVRSLLEALADLARVWADAPAAHQNLIARQVFRRLVVTDGRIVSIEPMPAFAPFYAKNPGSGEPGSGVLRKRRGSDRPNTTGVPVDWCCAPPRIHPQHRPALSVAQVMAIRHWGRDRSLRELAAEYGVSPETVRKARSGR